MTKDWTTLLPPRPPTPEYMELYMIFCLFGVNSLFYLGDGGLFELSERGLGQLNASVVAVDTGSSVAKGPGAWGSDNVTSCNITSWFCCCECTRAPDGSWVRRHTYSQGWGRSCWFSASSAHSKHNAVLGGLEHFGRIWGCNPNLEH